MTHCVVSVIIVNYNTEKQLLRCLDALTHQTKPAEEVLVIDNASSEGFSVDVLKKRYPWCQFVTLKENIGFSGANNLGAKLANKCEWICLLNPDAYPEPEWLEEMMSAAAELPSATHLACKMVLANRSDLLDGAGDVYHTSGAAWRRGRFRGEANYNHREQVLAVGAAAAFYRRRAWEEAGGLDETFFCYYEDVDLSLRLFLAGGQGYYIPSAKVHHEGGASVGGGNNFSTYYGHRNLMLTFLKNMPWPLLVLYLPQHLAVNFGAVLWCALRGQGRVALRAKLDALKLAPTVFKLRSQVQRSRKTTCMKMWRAMSIGFRPLLKHWLGANRIKLDLFP